MRFFKIIQACIVRAALFLHITLTIWRVTVDLNDEMYWLMFCASFPLVIESFYTIIARKGDDFKLFTPCFFCYLMTTVPCVWLLELRKTDVYLSGEQDQLFNITAKDDALGVAGNIAPNTWTILIEELLLYLIIVGRWLLPRGEITREQLSELLFAFIGIASDIMEMFSLFGQDAVRNNRILSYCLLGVWSLSVTQFCMTLTVTHQPRKAKNVRCYDDNADPKKEKPRIRNEIFAIFLSMIMQDVPFVTVRLYTIVKYDIINYSIIFFTAKNCLVICLQLYKIAVLIEKRYFPDKKSDEDDDDRELYPIGDDEKGRIPRPYHMDSNSDSTGGSKEKQNMEKYYENGGLDDSPAPAESGAAEPGVNNSNNTTPRSLANEKTPLKLSKLPSKQQQPAQSSTPTMKKRSPTSSSAGTPKTPTSKSSAYRPRPTPSQTPKSQPKGQPKGQPKQPAPKQETPPPDSVIASGYGWVSSKSDDQKETDVITDELS